MIFSRFQKNPPPPPPVVYSMEFSQDEGWTVLAALNDWNFRHPDAHNAKTVKAWVKELDGLLRAGV
jgi:hypothetical protein